MLKEGSGKKVDGSGGKVDGSSEKGMEAEEAKVANVEELLRRSNKVQWSSLLRVMEEAAKQR